MRLRKKNKGFALLEVIIAFSIVLIIIVPLIGMTGTVVKMGTGQKKREHSRKYWKQNNRF